MDAHRSALSVIVIDEIERLLDYNPIGPRFNNNMFQAFAVMMKKIPSEVQKKNKRKKNKNKNNKRKKKEKEAKLICV